MSIEPKTYSIRLCLLDPPQFYIPFLHREITSIPATHYQKPVITKLRTTASKFCLFVV